MSGGPAFPLVDDSVARELHLGERSELLFHVVADDGTRLVTRRPWLRDSGATMRAFDAHAAEVAGEHTQERWRYAQLVLPVAGGFAGLRIVLDWRSDTALVCEVAGPTAALVRRELDILDENFGPHRRFPPIRTAGRVVLGLAAVGAMWLSAMREQQSTPTAHEVAVATYLAILLGLALLVVHVARRGLPPRGLAPARFRPAHLRATIGWAWLGPATVFVLRMPLDPYVEWPLGYWLALAASLSYALACVPRPRPGQRLHERKGARSPRSGQSQWSEAPRSALTPALRPEPDRVVVPADGGAVAAYWRSRSRVVVDEQQWNAEEHTWPSDVGEISAELYDTWDGGPVRVVVARAYDRTLMVRSHDSRSPLTAARQLTDAWFGAAGTVAQTEAGTAPAPHSRWTVAVVVAWLCGLTFVVGSDLGPSTYVWQWPVRFEVDHDYPVLAAAAATAVLLAWGWAITSTVRLFASGASRREWRRAARRLAWQLVVVFIGAEILTFTLLPRLEALHAATAAWMLAVVHATLVVVALGVVVLIRPESPLGTTVGGRNRHDHPYG
ncbi:MAG: hypothetical protein ACQERF_02985 [Actinomycetota bacterium]